MNSAKIDQVDRTILLHLDTNGRMPLNQIASEMGMSKQALSYRVKKLTEQGTLRGFITVIDVHRLGYLSCRIYFRFRNVHRDREETIIKYFVQHPYALWVIRMEGVWDLEIVFLVRNIIHLNNTFKQLQNDLGRFFQRYNISMSPVSYHFRRDYLTGQVRQEFTRKYYGFEPNARRRDELDYKILQVIANNARMSHEDIARQVGCSYTVARHRIERLEHDQVIQFYRPHLDIEQLGRKYYKALLRLENLSEALERELYIFCSKRNFVVYLTEVLGDWQLEIETEVSEISELMLLLKDLRRAFPDNVEDYEVVRAVREEKINYFPMGVELALKDSADSAVPTLRITE